MMYAYGMGNMTFTVSMPAWYQILGGICSLVIFIVFGPVAIRGLWWVFLFLLESLWMIVVIDLYTAWHYKRISAVVASILCLPFCLWGYLSDRGFQHPASNSLLVANILLAFFILLCICLPYQNPENEGCGNKFLRKNYEDIKKGNLFEDNAVSN